MRERDDRSFTIIADWKSSDLGYAIMVNDNIKELVPDLREKIEPILQEIYAQYDERLSAILYEGIGRSTVAGHVFGGKKK